MLLAAFVPLTYVWAGDAWTLLPAFICQGLMQGGFELGITTGVIALAERGRVMEYTALQAATIGVRGMLAPLLGALLLSVGVSETLVLGIATGLVAISWIMLGAVRAPQPG